jgi:DNA-directed RNA polymerase specialized sigma24 family protein
MEETLFLLIKGKNKKAFNYFYNLCGATLYNFIDKNLKDKVHSEAVFQNVFVKISRDIDHYDPLKGTLYPWMFTIAQDEIMTENTDFYTRSGF